MGDAAPRDVTVLLRAWSRGDRSALDELIPLVATELHKIARGRMAAEREGQTLDATGLVHEAWLRLEKSAPKKWRDRKQFYAAAAEAMRRILVEAARRRLAAKRGGGQADLPLDDDLPVPAPVADDRLLGIHEVLDQLAPDIQWVESYVADNKTFCVYLAKDEAIIRKHAEISGFPATTITEVKKLIDPTTAAA